MYSLTALASFGSSSGFLSCHFEIASFNEVPPLAFKNKNEVIILPR